MAAVRASAMRARRPRARTIRRRRRGSPPCARPRRRAAAGGGPAVERLPSAAGCGEQQHDPTREDEAGGQGRDQGRRRAAPCGRGGDRASPAAPRGRRAPARPRRAARGNSDAVDDEGGDERGGRCRADPTSTVASSTPSPPGTWLAAPATMAVRKRGGRGRSRAACRPPAARRGRRRRSRHHHPTPSDPRQHAAAARQGQSPAEEARVRGVRASQTTCRR
jgi:hypothetical protein